MANWFSKKLGIPAPPAPAGPGQQVTPRQVVPGTWPGYGNGPSPVPVAPPQLQMGGNFSSFNAQGQQIGDDGFIRMVHDAAAATGGSAEARAGTGNCPNCRQPSLFTQDRSENGMPMRIPAQPHCYECGWPNLQAGSRNGPASMLKPKGQARAARQLPRDHVVTVMDGSLPVAYAPQPGDD